MGSIPLPAMGFVPPHVQDPGETLARAVSLREAVLNSQYRQQAIQNEQMRNQQQQMELQDQSVLRDAWGKANGDPLKLQQMVAGRISPTTMMKVNGEVAAWQKSNLEMGEAQIKQNKEKAERVSQIAGSINDETSLRNGLSMALQEKLIDNNTAQGLLTKGWNPETQATIQQMQKQGATYAQLHQAALDDVRTQTETQKLGQDRIKDAGTLLGATTDQASYAKAYYGSVHEKARENFDSPETWTPESADKARRFGLSAEQQVKAPAEQAKSQQETIAAFAGRLSAAPTQGTYAGVYYSAPKDIQAQFVNPKDWTPELGKAQAKIGLNANQAVQAQQRQERIDQRNKQTTPQQEKEIVSHLANIALQDSITGGGRRSGPEAYDDAVNNLRTYYKNNPDMQKYQEDVVDLLNKRKSTAGTADLKADKLSDEDNVRQLIYGTPKPGSSRPAPAPAAAPAAADTESVKSQIRAAATKNDVDPAQVLGLAESESGFDQKATSKTGARGVFQFTQATAKQVGIDREDQAQNIDGGVRYWKQLLQENKGDVGKAIAAFKGVSAGGATPDDVTKAQGLISKYTAAAPSQKKPSPTGPAVAQSKQPEPPKIVGDGLTVFYKGRYYPFPDEAKMDSALKELGFARKKQ